MKRRSFFWLALMALVLALAGPISQIRAAEVSYKITNQDVTADYFVFNRSDCQGGLLTHAGGAGNQQDLAQVDHPNRKEFPNNQPAHPKSQPQVTGNFYQVKNGDTLYSISRKIGISVEDISRFNNLGIKPVLHTGQILRY